MQLTLCPLFSGSSGNCTYIASGGTRLLVDAGVSAKRITDALAALGTDIREIDAILVTHEHDDHIRALDLLCSRYGVPVYATAGTLNGILRKATRIPEKCCHELYGEKQGSRFLYEDLYIGSFNVHPFQIPHDALEPVGFRFESQGICVGFATDIGHISESWLSCVRGCQAVLLEANHDVELVQRGAYPQHLKRRILGTHGHLSNENCGKALLELIASGTQTAYLAHLSDHNNLPELAFNTVASILAEANRAPGRDIRLLIARRDAISDLTLLSNDPPAQQPAAPAFSSRGIPLPDDLL